MSEFEFFMMIASVVVALGISEIIGNWGRLLRNNELNIQFDWLYVGTCIVLPLIIIQYWIGMWAYAPIEFVTNFQIVFLIVPSVFAVLGTFIIAPDAEGLETFDCRAYYMAQRRYYFLTLAAFGILSLIADFVVIGSTEVELTAIVIFTLGTALSIYLAWTPKIWIHGTSLVLSCLNLIMFFFSDFEVIANRFI